MFLKLNKNLIQKIIAEIQLFTEYNNKQMRKLCKFTAVINYLI